MRLDQYLVAKGFAGGRDAAKRLIADGEVTVNGTDNVKPSLEISDDDTISVLNTLRYVSRGGLKLEKALEVFGIDVTGLCCLDIGASTGGFTDCLLQHGARYVYAVDVGHGQLAPSLRTDKRVKCTEGYNIRNAAPDDFDTPIDFICTDVSFISLKLVIPVVKLLLSPGGKAVLLIKPQFECGKKDIGKGGIVRDKKVQTRVTEEIRQCALDSGFDVAGLIPSPISGGSGNTEYLIALDNKNN
ncbi:MAG: TlyA family RNA methyltransferase [Oscillospiraceae bacterium]|nr:TlyA family RNA methyltransferase [Oscillospiraceae bacterium]